MKKSKKWTLISMLIGIPIVILTVFFIISDVSIKIIPLWAVIGTFVVILLAPFIFFIVQRKADNAPLQKRRKLLLILLTVFILILLIIAIRCHILEISFGQVLLTNIAGIVFLIGVFFYAFFRKDKSN